MKRMSMLLGMLLMFAGSCYSANKFELSGLNFGFTGDVEIGTATISSATITVTETQKLIGTSVTINGLTVTSITVNNGIANIPYYYSDVPVKSQTAIFNDGVGVSSDTLAAGGTTYVTADLTQPGIPRNVVIIATNGANSSGQSTMTIVSGSCWVQGINSVGQSTNEYVTIVSTENESAGRGNIAWISISSVTIKNIVFSRTPNATLYIQIGTSDKIGLFNNLTAAGDVIKVIENGADTTTYTVSATHRTITFVNAPDSSKDYLVVQKVKKTPQ